MNKLSLIVLVLCFFWLVAGNGVASAAELRTAGPVAPGPSSEAGPMESTQRTKPVVRSKMLNINDFRKRMFLNRAVVKKKEFKASEEKP